VDYFKLDPSRNERGPRYPSVVILCFTVEIRTGDIPTTNQEF